MLRVLIPTRPSCKDPFISNQHEHLLTHCSQDSMRNINDIIPGVFSNFGYHTSQPEDFACVKAVTRHYDREEVVRSCSIPRADTFDVCSQLKSRDLTFCETCTSESCNGARGLAPLALLAAAPVLALLFNKY
ncbi:uncharacterized protein LOC124362419 [Homalodisca vitripennis]|uniref:uncharacterized protein LOC124362419 n=1 Tax=Homalodisca vitripennis TaxID=197043 RepID=UPI001EE9C981|nr:uncharacterized protein LOC124362419 [Homalodisca vitripennis]